MIPNPPVVAVDDNPADLKAITEMMFLLDSGCLPVLVENAAPKVSSPLREVRLLLFDMNYLPTQTSDQLMFETAIAVLSKVLAKNNGPYILITWSTYAAKHKEFMRSLAEASDILPLPAATAVMEKEHFRPPAGGRGDTSVVNLREEIRKRVSQCPQVEALLWWEVLAKRAAGEVISSLLELVSPENRCTGAAGPYLERILSRVARAAVGEKNVDSNRLGAVNTGLAPVLFDRLVALGEDHGAEAVDIWKKAIPQPNKKPDSDEREVALLNRLGLFAFENLAASEAGSRGAVSSLSMVVREKLESGGFGASVDQVVSEFMERKGVPKKGIKATEGDLRPVLHWAEIREQTRWVLVGLRAACDEAQQHGVLRRVALALEVPHPLPNGTRLKLHGAKSETPIFQLGNPKDPQNHRQLVFNWHWILTLTPAQLIGSEVLYRLREPLMNMLGSHFGEHAMRPGIIEYRPG